MQAPSDSPRVLIFPPLLIGGTLPLMLALPFIAVEQGVRSYMGRGQRQEALNELGRLHRRVDEIIARKYEE